MEEEFDNDFRYRNICFVSYDTRAPKDTIEEHDFKKYIKYMVYQLEKCPSTSRLHYQGYCEFFKGLTRDQIKKIFNYKGLNIRNRRGSQEQAIVYCKKEKSRVGEQFEYGQKREQGHRTDLDEFARLAPTTSIRTLVEQFGGNALRHIGVIRKYQELIYGDDPIENFLRRNEKKELTTDKAIIAYNQEKINDLLESCYEPI